MPLLNSLRILAYKILYKILPEYFRLFQIATRGAHCLIECNGKILLIKNTYRPMNWRFPGGGIKKNELPENAVTREIREELGITLIMPRLIGTFLGSEFYENDTVHSFYSEVADFDLLTDAREICKAQWFDWEKLPQPLSADTERIIEIYRSTKTT